MFPIYYRYGIYAEICAFWNGNIYAIFSQHEPVTKLDLRFHIYNTQADSWTVSETLLHRDSYRQVAALIPNE